MNHDLLSKLDGALAPNTIRAYRSDFAQFSTWCSEIRINPLAASADEIAAFIAYSEQRCATATVCRRIASLSSLLTLNGYDDPTRHPEVILALKRMYRKKGRRQQQAYPLTKDILDLLIAICGDDLVGQRDRVLLLLGYETMRRRSELCSLKYEDLEHLPKGKVALRLRFSKTDQFGDGRLLPVSPELYAAMQAWGESVDYSGCILRSIDRHGNIGDQLTASSLNLRLQKLQIKAGLQIPGRLTGHSFRVGGAVDLLEAGESLEKIMLRAGWTSESTAVRYLRGWQAV